MFGYASVSSGMFRKKQRYIGICIYKRKLLSYKWVLLFGAVCPWGYFVSSVDSVYGDVVGSAQHVVDVLRHRFSDVPCLDEKLLDVVVDPVFDDGVPYPPAEEDSGLRPWWEGGVGGLW